MRGMLLAAGLGTRLRPLTDERPKPVVPLGFEPLAARAVATLRAAGVRRIDANAHHLAHAIEPAIAPLVGDLPLSVHVETRLLGTAGGLRNALHGADEPVLVVNGDVDFAPDPVPLRAAAERLARGDALAAMVLRSHPEPDRLGAVETDAEGRVLRIAGAPSHAVGDVVARRVFTGAYLLSAEAIDRLPAEGCVVRQALWGWLAEGERVIALVDDSPWADLGTLPEYLHANLARAAASADPRGLVHPSARVAGATLQRCVIGREAHVAPGTILRDCVVWDGASATASATRTVFTRARAVPID